MPPLAAPSRKRKAPAGSGSTTEAKAPTKRPRPTPSVPSSSRSAEPRRATVFDDPIDTGSDTEPDDIQNLSVPILVGAGRYFAPREQHLIPLDCSRDGFGPAPLGPFVRAFKRPVRRALRPAAPPAPSMPARSCKVGSRQTAEASKPAEPVQLELPRALTDVAPEHRPSPEWQRVWYEISTRLAPRAARGFRAVRAGIEGQLRRVHFTMLRELKRKAVVSFRGLRDTGLRAKRLVRDMQMYWRRYEQESAETQRHVDRVETERRRTDTERLERERQQRKLEFLLTQTELFSHFIGKKMGVVPAGAAAPGSAADGKAPGGQAGAQGSGSTAIAAEELKKIRGEAEEATKGAIARHFERAAKFDRDFAVAAKPAPGPGRASPVLAATDAQPQQVKTPSLFNGKLKSYQLKGLNWLANLYEQGINGILADEMGLGKTVQSIAFLAHLAETKQIWGPFLVVCPNSTLHQWQQEVTKFCPDLRVMPYWGSQSERKTIRKYWKPELLYKRDAAFHVMITSYNVAVSDEKYFPRLKWQFLLLDEAQAIKNAASLRWKSLLNLKCRNRLLLTGTPIQNSMAELWALLHFIMPDFFDSHDEFNEWFSKDIQGHAQGDKQTLDAHQVQRLHMILKPFMLRRIKSDVEHEMAPKIEVQVNCPLSRRQRLLYDALRGRVSADGLLANAESLMNLVMQFRKVCNHPEIFKRRSVEQPVTFLEPQPFLEKYEFNNWHIEPEAYKRWANPLAFRWPKLLSPALGDTDMSSVRQWGAERRAMAAKFDIFRAHYIHTSLFGRAEGKRGNAFAFTRLADLTPAEVEYVVHVDATGKWLAELVNRGRRQVLSHEQTFGGLCGRASRAAKVSGLASNLETRTMLVVPTSPVVGGALAPLTPFERLRDAIGILGATTCYCDKVVAPPVTPLARGAWVPHWHHRLLHDPIAKGLVSGAPLPALANTTLSRTLTRAPASMGLRLSGDRTPSLYPRMSVFSARDRRADDVRAVTTVPCAVRRIFGSSTSMAHVPNFGKLLSDSGKLCALDMLLKRLRAGGHRTLIFSQMTKMIDILEDYMRYRKIKFFRLDGQTSLADRRDMVREFQRNPEYFAFLLSTRAGGLGINLTGADTVIFYDNDWNPTMDAQAMDRVHRIGQTKQVTVYRLVCKNTVEERILRRAQIKHTIQKTVYSGGFRMQANETDGAKELSTMFKANELRDIVLGDENGTAGRPASPPPSKSEAVMPQHDARRTVKASSSTPVSNGGGSSTATPMDVETAEAQQSAGGA